MRAWKWVGLAGIAGVAATGVVIARSERQRRAYAPEDVRARLHERARAVQTMQDGESTSAPTAPTAHEPLRARLTGLWRRVVRAA